MTDQQKAEIAYYQELEQQYYEPKELQCPFCYGEANWEVECCSGAGGCSCRGGLVDMGTCNVCGGRGYVIEGHYNPSANANYIYSTGACFAGSGPTSGYWSRQRALGRPRKY